MVEHINDGVNLEMFWIEICLVVSYLVVCFLIYILKGRSLLLKKTYVFALSFFLT